MAEVYVYSKDCEDFANFGLVGALTPISCIFEEEANGMSEITMVHPIDDFGKYTSLVCENLLMAEVPVRTTPEISGGKIVTSVEQWTVKSAATITKAQRTLYRKKSGSRKIKILPGGAEVTVVEKPDEGRYKVKCRYGTGFMEPAGLDFVQAATIADKSQSIESVQPAWTVRPQLFRIYNIEKSINRITVSARHVSYDLLYNLTSFESKEAVSCVDALAGIMNNTFCEHEFEAHTNIASTRTGVSWQEVNPIEALLNPENGLTTLYQCSLVRDNWDLYLLNDPGMNRGVTIEYGKNLIGLKCSESYENVVTRIVPVGETKDGKPLYLSGTKHVDSPKIGSYATHRVQMLKCTDCKVGTDGVTTAIARARMQEQAEAVFAGGGDTPEVEMSVDFIKLGGSEKYSQYRDLERLFLWDYVIIRHKLLNLDVTARIVSIEWDCVSGRMKGMEIGKVGKTLANSGITTWQIPTGFSGSKIAGGTIGGGALMGDIISTRHLQAQSVNTQALQAGSVTAGKIAAEAVTAEKLDADTVNARIADIAIANLTTANIKDANIDWAQIGQLQANIAQILQAQIGTADIGFGQIKDLVAGSAIITEGVGGQLYIARLAVTEANMVRLTTGELVVKGADGHFYSVGVGEDGNVKATLKQVSNGDVTDLSINAGEKLIEGTVTAACLNAADIFANNAMIRKLIAANIDVAELFANNAFISQLHTSRIYGGQSIEMIVNNAAKASQNFRQESAPDGSDGVKAGDLWVIPSTGQTWQATDAGDLKLKFAVDETGVLAYEVDGDPTIYKLLLDDNLLTSEGFAFPLDAEGMAGAAYVWIRVQDQAILNSLNQLADAVDGKSTTWYQASAPASPDSGDIWYDTNAGRIKRWSGTAWVDITTSALKAALDAAGTAQATADGKIRTFAQTGAPTGMGAGDVGDLWIDTDDKNKLYRWSGTAWAAYRDAMITDAMNAVEDANGRIDGLDDSMGAQMARIEADYLSRPEFERVVRVESEGLYIGDNLSPEQLLLGSGYINFLVDGALYSRMGKRQAQFGNYILGLAPDDGLAFRPAGG